MTPTTARAPDARAALPARERILHTAHDLFYRDGIRATGVDRVIAEAGVTKVTFYRHYPSKQALIGAFLEFRHARWMAWFADALQRHRPARGAALGALVPALGEWFASDLYRGCAFINAVVEVGGTLPAAVEASRRHKDDMAAMIAGLLPASRRRALDAQAIALAVDGAILRAQLDGRPEAALKALRRCLEPFLPARRAVLRAPASTP